jgi:alkylation response protein AidB-like acyl-CoA dehydrogenase
MSAATDDRAESVRLIRDSAAGLAPRTGDLRRIRALRFEDPGFDRAVWKQMCEMGWPGLRLAEDAGGSALGMAEYCAIAEEMGAALAPEPLIQVAMAARALAATPHISAILAGERIVIPAWQERANTLDIAGDTTTAGGRANGRKLFIPQAAGADAFLVSSRDGLALVERDAPGVELAIERTQDGGNFGTLTLTDAPCTPVAGDLLAAQEEATLATAAYLLGVMDRVFAMTVDYLKTRVQFGKPIGSFQALQHRAADLKIQVSLARASVESVAVALDSGLSGPARLAAISRAKARASESGMLVCRQAIQLHGGIGYTDEADPGLFLRKTMVLSNLLGSATLHRARFAALAPDGEEG